VKETRGTEDHHGGVAKKESNGPMPRKRDRTMFQHAVKSTETLGLKATEGGQNARKEKGVAGVRSGNS